MAHLFKKLEDDVLEAEVRHDERKIADKREDMNEHELEESYDKSDLMKDLRSSEIHHDEKVMEKKAEDAAKHEEKLKANEQAICGCSKK